MTEAGGKGAKGELQRVIRVRDGLAITVGMIIGAGILGTPGKIAGWVGEAWAILGIWLLGGVVAGLSTLLFAEMAAALPNAGGKYVYAKAAFGPLAGFVAGWSEIIVTRAFSGAAKAVLVAVYATSLAGRGSVPVVAGTVALAFFLLHMGGLKVGTRVQNITTVVKVLVLAGIAAAGIMSGSAAGFHEPLRVAPEYAGLLGFALAYQAVAFAYYGWEDAAKMAEEVKDPGRSLPKILLGGAMAVAVVYLLINVAFLVALTPAQMNGSPLVAEDAIRGVLGNAPAALIFISILILGLAVSGTFEFLIRFMMLVAITVDLMVLLGFFRLRRKRPDLHRPMRVPAYPWLPGLAVVLYLAVLAIIILTQPSLALGAGAMLLALIAAGWFTVRSGSLGPSA